MSTDLHKTQEREMCTSLRLAHMARVYSVYIAVWEAASSEDVGVVFVPPDEATSETQVLVAQQADSDERLEPCLHWLDGLKGLIFLGNCLHVRIANNRNVLKRLAKPSSQSAEAWIEGIATVRQASVYV